MEQTIKRNSLNSVSRGAIRVPDRAEIQKSMATSSVPVAPVVVGKSETRKNKPVVKKTTHKTPRVTFESMMNSAPSAPSVPSIPSVPSTPVANNTPAVPMATPVQLSQVATPSVPAPIPQTQSLPQPQQPIQSQLLLQPQQLQAAVQIAAQQPALPVAVNQAALAGAEAAPMPQVAPLQEVATTTPSKKNKIVDKLKEGQRSIKNSFSKKKPASEEGAKKSILPKLPKISLRPVDMVRYGVVAVVLIISGYLAYDTWTTNQQAKDIFSQPAAAADSSGVVDESGNPDESAIDVDSLANYQVAPDMPRLINIPKIGVNARVLHVGLTSGNKIAAPEGIHDTGWYTGSAKPGEKGAAFIGGHMAGANLSGVFQNLDKLSAGDSMTVERGDGTKFNYKVVDVVVIPLAQVDMREVLSVKNDREQGLNLMTCAGRYTANGYDHRVIVYSVKV